MVLQPSSLQWDSGARFGRKLLFDCEISVAKKHWIEVED